jgi:hypothetical protein
MVRFLFLLHRYLGIGIGLIMLLWTLSGIVMMYKPYPELDRWQSLSLRNTLQFDGCCSLPDSPITRADTFSNIRVEMLRDSPVLRMNTVERGLVSFNLATGRAFVAIDEPQAASVAQHFVQSTSINGPFQAVIIPTDHCTNTGWTIQPAPSFTFPAVPVKSFS